MRFQRESNRRFGNRTAGWETSSPTRQLIRLSIALMLVLAIMQRASDPMIYQRMFDRLGIPTENDSSNKSPETSDAQRSENSTAPSTSSQTPNFLHFAQSLPKDQFDRLVSWLMSQLPNAQHFEPETSSPGSDPRAHPGSASDLISPLVNHDHWPEGQTAAKIADDLIRLSLGHTLDQSQWGEMGPLLSALDRRLIDGLDDPRLLRPKLTLAERWLVSQIGLRLFNSLDSPNQRVVRGDPAEGSGATAGGVGTIPLMQQSEVYRGQILRLRGQVARVDRLSDNLSRLWVKPADGSQRPVVFLVDQLPDGVTVDTRLEQPNVHEGIGTGWYVGRVTYPSVGGIETAPMFVGRMSLKKGDRVLKELSPSTGTVGARLAKYMVVGVLVFALVMSIYFRWDEKRHVKRSGKPQQISVPSSFGQVNDAEPPS